MTIATLVQMLSKELARPVFDRTELTGSFDIKLEWTPDSAGTPGESIFSALTSQLGLRLDGAKRPMAITVIDSAARPGEN